MFFNLSGDGDGVRVWWWGIIDVGLGFLVLFVRDDFRG